MSRLPGAYVAIRLPMWKKNQYVLVFGPSEADGNVRISHDELVARAREEQDAFPMDYASFPSEWTGGLGAQVLDREGVQRLREAIELWGERFYPPEFARTLDDYEQRLRELEGRRPQAEVARSDGLGLRR